MSTWTRDLGRAAAMSAFGAALSMSCTPGSDRQAATPANAMEESNRTPSDAAHGPGNQGGQTLNSENMDYSKADFANAGAPTPVQNTPRANRERPDVTMNNEPGTFVAPPSPTSVATSPPAEPETGRDRAVDNETAIHEIAAARCEREADCDKIGRDGRYETQTDCVLDEDRAEFGDIGPEQCREGIDRDKLATCVSDLRTEDCKGSMGAIPQLPACSASTLCMTD